MVTAQLNSRHLKKIGFLAPKNIHNKQDAVQIDEAREKANISSDAVHFDEQLKNIKAYDKKTNVLKPGDYVFLDFNPKLTKKGYLKLKFLGKND